MSIVLQMTSAIRSKDEAKMGTISITTPEIPPEWSLWQRHFLDRLYPAAVEFFAKYTRDNGTIIWRDEWPGMDGYESSSCFPLYYALGGPEPLNAL